MAPRLQEVIKLFLKLGVIAFGGPAAHVAMMHDEAVRRRAWVTESEFLDLLGIANLIPGPNSTEMAIFLGYKRAGWKGLVAGGVCFILPAMAIVLLLSWAYVRYGSAPQAMWLLYGIKPVVIAVIIQALRKLFGTAIKGPQLAGLGLLVLVLYLLGLSAVALIFGAGLLLMVARNGRRLGRGGLSAVAFLPALGTPPVAAASFSLSGLFFVFLKIGSVIFGSGYVLLAFLRTDFVEHLRWLTDQQVLDAVAVGQFTPGPVFTTATFIGYLVGGPAGAVLGTVGIFLPSFVFTAIAFPLVGVLRRSPWAGAFLDGVNVGALGLMTGVTIQLGRTALVDGLTFGVALAAMVALFRYRINSAWIILGGGLIGLLCKLTGWSL
jgi:chromate transporter